jgi:hypothetical protein
MNVIDIARLFLFVRESGDNRGLRVEAIQHWSQGQFGDSWCAEFATMVLDLFCQGQSPIPRGGSCQAIYDLAKQNGWVQTPSEGDLYLYINEADHAHHVGLVTALDPLTGIAGNTSADGTSSNGDRVAEHALAVSAGSIQFVAWPRP